MTPQWISAYLSLGSNLGKRKRNLSRAKQFLRENRKIRIQKSAALYETSPIGQRQRKFLNTALKIETDLSPFQLLSALKKIEEKMGRKKTKRWGPRIVDLDIIFYGQHKIRSRRLTIPHPEFQKRKFVLQPLSEIAPRFKPPGIPKTVSSLLLELTESKQKVKLIS